MARKTIASSVESGQVCFQGIFCPRVNSVALKTIETYSKFVSIYGLVIPLLVVSMVFQPVELLVSSYATDCILVPNRIYLSRASYSQPSILDFAVSTQHFKKPSRQASHFYFVNFDFTRLTF